MRMYKRAVITFCIVAAAIVFYLILANFGVVFSAFQKLISILNPVFVGFIIAYLAFPICRFYENRMLRPLFKKMRFKQAAERAKGVGIALGLITFAAVIAGVVVAILPQLLMSSRNLFGNLNRYLVDLNQWALNKMTDYPDVQEKVNDFFKDLSANLSSLIQNNISEAFNNLANIVTGSFVRIGGAVLNIVMGMCVSVYFLYNREKFVAQSKKLVFGIFPKSIANEMLRTMRMTNKYFSAFITGKIIDSIIIGVLFFITLSLCGFKYAILLSVVLGVTNVVHYFGPIIGAVPCLFLIWLEQPEKVILLGFIILIMQQFDGNILGPKILGDSTGLSGFWVIFSLLLFGGLFGFAGLVIGIPLFAVVYALVKERVTARLRKRGLPEDTDLYREVTEL